MSLSKGIQSAAAAALSAAMLIALAACGTTDSTDTAAKSGDSSKDSSSTSIQGFDTSSIQKDDEIAALLPDSVTSDGTLTVGADTSYAPAEFLAEDGKTPVGFDVDLSKAIAAVFGLKEETISSTFDSIIPSVGSKYDLGISSFTVTKERMQAVDFVTYFKAGSTYVVQKGNPNKVDSSNLCGVKVAVQTGTTQEEEVNKANEQCKADGKDAIDIQSSKLQTDVTPPWLPARPPSSTPIPRCPPTPSSRPATPWRRSVKTPAGCPRPWPSRRAIPRPPKPCRRPSRS